MGLEHLQQHMMAFLLETAQGTPSSHEAELQRLLTADSPPEGLRIYSHAYGTRLVEVLRNDHEKLYNWLGSELFEIFARAYVASHPSTVRSLRHYGAGFPSFLAELKHPKAERAAQLCLFERTLMDAYDSASAPRLAADHLMTLTPERWPVLKLRCHPSVRVFTDTAAAVSLWQEMNGAPGSPPSSEVQHWLLWRDHNRVCQFRHLQAAEHIAFTAMGTSHLTLADTAERLLETLSAEQIATQLQQFLGQWFVDGLVSDTD